MSPEACASAPTPPDRRAAARGPRDRGRAVPSRASRVPRVCACSAASSTSGYFCPSPPPGLFGNPMHSPSSAGEIGVNSLRRKGHSALAEGHGALGDALGPQGAQVAAMSPGDRMTPITVPISVLLLSSCTPVPCPGLVGTAWGQRPAQGQRPQSQPLGPLLCPPRTDLSFASRRPRDGSSCHLSW